MTQVSTDLRQKLLNLENALNGELLERYVEVHTACLAIASRRHHFQIGPPGTAKSLLVSRLVLYIEGLGEQDYFHWLLTKHTLPDELYGPPDLGEMVDNKKFKRSTAFKMPVAKIAFLDEIFKGNSAILNANLTIMNERKFFDDERPKTIDLACVFAASNEMPQGDELTALYDRLHIRHQISAIRDVGNWVKMLDLQLPDNPEPVISWQDILEIQAAIPHITIAHEANVAMKELRAVLVEQGIEPSDRRWHDCRDIIRAEAYMNGRSIAIVDDLRPLEHVLWSDPKEIREVSKAVLALAAPLDRDANQLMEDVEELTLELKRALREHGDDPNIMTDLGIEIYTKMRECKKRKVALEIEFDEVERNKAILNEIEQRLRTLAETIAVDTLELKDIKKRGR